LPGKEGNLRKAQNIIRDRETERKRERERERDVEAETMRPKAIAAK